MRDVQCEPMHPDEDGWSEWIHPLPGYLMQCCDCKLIHEMELAIGEREGDGPLNEGESDETGVILFRARRHQEDVVMEKEHEPTMAALDLCMSAFNGLENWFEAQQGRAVDGYVPSLIEVMQRVRLAQRAALEAAK